MVRIRTTRYQVLYSTCTPVIQYYRYSYMAVTCTYIQLGPSTASFSSPQSTGTRTVTTWQLYVNWIFQLPGTLGPRSTLTASGPVALSSVMCDALLMVQRRHGGGDTKFSSIASACNSNIRNCQSRRRYHQQLTKGDNMPAFRSILLEQG